MARADVSYVPGALTAVTGGQCWALVETAPDSPAVARIWQQLGQGVAADALLAGLLADGIGGTPGFALLVAGPGGQHRLFCRGTVGATVVTGAPDGGAPPGAGQSVTTRIDGAGLLTWREQLVDRAERIFLGGPPAGTSLRLPATSGVLLAGCVVVDLTNSFFPDTITMTSGSGTAPASDGAPAAGQPAPAGYGPVVTLAPVVTTAPVVATAPVPPFAPSPASLPGPAAGPGRADGRESAAAPRAAVVFAAGLDGLPGGLSGPVAPGPAAASAPALPAAPAAAVSLASDDDEDYDSFWGATQARSVEDAAMRAGGPVAQVPPDRFPPNGVPTAGLPVDGGPPPGAFPSGPWPATYPDGAPPAPHWPGPPGPAAPAGMPANPPLPGVPPVALAPPSAAPPPGAITSPPGPAVPRAPRPPGGLIDAPSWLTGPGETGPGPGRGMPGTPASGWESPGAQPYVPRAPQAGTGPGESSSTVKRGELAEIADRTTPPDRIGPVVPALLCPSGHVNPPSGAVCRRCGAPLPHDPVPVPRPVLGVLRLSFGDVITLDRGVLMGRNPRTDFAGTDGEERPHVVKLPAGDGDISRTHLRVTLDGWHVLVTDLNSTNGTLVTLPGRDPQQLRPAEPVPIQPGTVVTLADGIDFRYEAAE